MGLHDSFYHFLSNNLCLFRRFDLLQSQWCLNLEKAEGHLAKRRVGESVWFVSMSLETCRIDSQDKMSVVWGHVVMLATLAGPTERIRLKPSSASVCNRAWSYQNCCKGCTGDNRVRTAILEHDAACRPFDRITC